MYIHDTPIVLYLVAAILGLAVGQFIDWMNKRLPEYKKVFSKEIFTEYFAEFKPNYILMLITAIIRDYNSKKSNKTFIFASLLSIIKSIHQERLIKQ